MLAEVLTSAASWNSEHQLLTYQVPPEMEPDLRVGQLVAIPYGERLVEGIVWNLNVVDEDDEFVSGSEREETLRTIRTILDPEPALLAHQMALAAWISEYYVTPLAQVAQMMLPPGLLQRSHVVLRLAEDAISAPEERREGTEAGASLQIQALIGLLLSEGEVDIERLKKMLGPKRAREILKEARASVLIAQDAQLEAPRAKARVKRVVRLLVQGEDLLVWRAGVEARILQRAASLPANVQTSPSPITAGRGSRPRFDPWAMSGSTLLVEPEDKESKIERSQLAAIDLLLQNANGRIPWTPGALCKTCGLTRAHLQRLVRERIISIDEMEVRRDPLLGRTIPVSTPLPLTSDQQRALEQILSMGRDDDSHEFGAGQGMRPLLLHGVTGSGKTEVYLQALAAIIKQGKRGIVLVPEIALTTQAVQRVAGRFPGRVAIIHSELSVGERYDEWRRIRSGQVDVVIGSRSALFAPLADLGIIIIDEEHEPAYKQAERRPSYHAREAAIKLGQILHIPVVLGSATPAVETFYRAEQQHYELVELTARIRASLPPVEIVDLRNELRAGHTSIISRRLQEELQRVLALGQQAILFLNRRGAASCVLCRDCGFVALCDRCDIPLTYHSTERMLLCHYCGKQSKVLHFCPGCRSSSIRYFGLGTEKVQATLQSSFPEARLLRWDRDTARNRRAHELLLDRFANREADILIGTQMIAKGLDLPGVTLVGVISADIALNMPDFAASERAFTLLTQVAGRAGRGEEAGHVIVQTFNPQHFSIEAAASHDYHGFYKIEIETRQRYGYPPFRHFVKFTYSHENRQRSQNEALLLYERLTEWIELLDLKDTDIVGPAPALMERLRGKYRWQLIARGPDLHPLLRVINVPGWEVDIDPISAM